MTYREATEYLFNAAPLFQNIGAGAYKEGLTNTTLLDNHFGNPHKKFQTIHVGGTNGKGSVSHTLAAILQAQGYKVGLYTSPHLVDFRERIRVNGIMIPEQKVIDFIEKERSFFEPLHPSFFEITTSMAFQYFGECQIDIAVVEVGLGGRLDCTNIITPILSVITNISFDHIQFLGDTLDKIAAEKAGIIKHKVPVVVGESENKSVKTVFEKQALKVDTHIVFADEEKEIKEFEQINPFGYKYHTQHFGTISAELGGLCQQKNTATILECVKCLCKSGIKISNDAIHHAFEHVCELTGLRGRWQILNDMPLTICDTAHNVGGMKYIIKQLSNIPHQQLHIIIGMVNDKDVNTVLSLLPSKAKYYFTQASVNRALPAEEIAHAAEKHGLYGNIYSNVQDAMKVAINNAKDNDIIFIGGSTFIVADALKSRIKH